LREETTQLCFKGTIFREGGLVEEEGRKFEMGGGAEIKQYNGCGIERMVSR